MHLTVRRAASSRQLYLMSTGAFNTAYTIGDKIDDDRRHEGRSTTVCPSDSIYHLPSTSLLSRFISSYKIIHQFVQGHSSSDSNSLPESNRRSSSTSDPAWPSRPPCPPCPPVTVHARTMRYAFNYPGHNTMYHNRSDVHIQLSSITIQLDGIRIDDKMPWHRRGQNRPPEPEA